MQSEDYIGQPLSDCPDGTVAVVQYADSGSDVYIRTKGGFATASKHGDEWVPWCDHGSGDGVWPTVLHIIKLGKPRPGTFADCEPGEVWQEPGGTLHWSDDDGEMVFLGSDGIPSPNFPSTDQCWRIGPDWTRLGQIEGIVINGKVYGKESPHA